MMVGLCLHCGGHKILRARARVKEGIVSRSAFVVLRFALAGELLLNTRNSKRETIFCVWRFRLR